MLLRRFARVLFRLDVGLDGDVSSLGVQVGANPDLTMELAHLGGLEVNDENLTFRGFGGRFDANAFTVALYAGDAERPAAAHEHLLCFALAQLDGTHVDDLRRDAQRGLNVALDRDGENRTGEVVGLEDQLLFERPTWSIGLERYGQPVAHAAGHGSPLEQPALLRRHAIDFFRFHLEWRRPAFDDFHDAPVHVACILDIDLLGRRLATPDDA